MGGVADRNAHGASLAACMTNVTGPIKPAVAIHIASEIVRLVNSAHAKEASVGKKVTHVTISPENVFIGYDGAVEVLGIPGLQRMQPSPPNPAYHAPEQVSGGSTDGRAEVFALGVVLWELFAGTPLFARESAAATRFAITEGRVPYVCDSNPNVAPSIADTLVTALRFDKHQRFETLDAFAKALVNARAAAGITTAASRADVASWLAERVPRAGQAASSPPANAPISAPPPSALPVSAAPMIPDLDLAPSTRMPAISNPPASVRTSVPAGGSAPSASVRSASPPGAGGGRAVDFNAGDDDPFDMEIERNVASTSLATATSSRAPGAHSGRPSGGGGLRPGLELAAPSRMARAAASDRQHAADEPGVGMKLAGVALSAVLGAATAFTLWKYVYHARGLDVTRAFPHAFDGTSAPYSGAVSLVALVVAVALGVVGLKVRPHAWAIVASGGLMLLLAIAMVTVTLGSTGENTVPPDGGLLVPYLLPGSFLLLSLGLVGRAGRRFAVAYGARRAMFVPIAMVAGAVGYIAFELSRLAR